MKVLLTLLIGSFYALSQPMVFMVENEDGKHIGQSTSEGKYQLITDGESWHLYPDISQDSKSIVFVRGNSEKELQIVVKDNHKNTVFGSKSFTLQPKFAKNDQLIFASRMIEGKNQIIKMDLNKIKSTMSPSSVNGELIYSDSFEVVESEKSYFPVPFQSGEKIVFQRNTDRKEIIIKDLLTNKDLIIGEGMSPTLSKDEMYIAYTSKVDGNWDIYIYNILTKKTHRATNNSAMDFSPAFHPNGDLYYTSDRNENGVFSIFYQKNESWLKSDFKEIEFLTKTGTSFYAPRFSGDPKYNLSLNQKMPGKTRSSFGAIEHQGKIYIVGGHQGAEHTYPPESFTGRVTVYDIKKKEWKNLSPRIHACHGFQLSAQGNYLYAFGGFAYEASTSPKWKSLDVVERYNIKLDKWEVVSQMPRKRSSNIAATIGSKVYLIGGWDSTPKYEDDVNGTFHDEIDVYDMSTNSFKTLKQKLPLKRRAFSSFVKDQRIYLVGGISEGGSHFALLDNFTEFDPLLNIFSEKKKLPFPTFAPAAGNIKESSFMFGGMLKLGEWNYEYVSHIYEYSFKTNSWFHSGRYLSEDKGFSQVIKSEDDLGILGGHSYQNNTDRPVDTFELLSI